MVPVRGSSQGEVKAGTIAADQSNTILYRRPVEYGIQLGFMLPLSKQVLIGPVLLYGISNISPRLLNASITDSEEPEIRSLALHLSFSILL